jgi:hypothetical protein
MKIRICLFLLLFSFIKVSGQQVDSDSFIREIKLNITAFFVEQGLLDKSTAKSNLNYVFANELHEKKIIGYNTTGIYNIGVLKSHSLQHILIKEKSAYRIFNIKEINILLKEVIEYAARNKIEESLMIFYIKKIIQMYEYSINSPIGADKQGGK